MKFPSRKLATRSSGFIISLEFLLVVAVVVIPLMIGMILLGRKLITLYLNQVAMMEQPLARPVVWDSSGTAKPVGPVIGYDSFAAPTVLFRDRTGILFGTDEFTPGVLLGIRPNRFSTTSRTYYDGAGCTGTPYVKSAASIGPWPIVGFISQTQGINYAVGSGNILYRESALGTAGANVAIASYWVSQDVGDASPAGTPSTACVEITGTGLTVVSLDDSGTGTTVTGVTTVVHAFSPGDFVTIAGAGNAAYDGVYQVTSASGRHFTFTGVGGLGASLGGTATRSATIPNLVTTTLVADLDSGANFTAPYRVAFPTNVTGAPLVSTGG